MVASRLVGVLGLLGLLALPCPALARTARSPAAEAPFTCTQVMGVSVTGDWFGAGFEGGGIDDGRWQAMTRKHAFIDQWANPKDELWSVPVVSPCAKDATSPDRVLIQVVNWEFKTTAEWTAALTRVVEVLRARYPRLRRLELLTMLRAPGNKSCGNPMSVVAPFVDEAVAKVAAAHPDLVKVAPKIEAPSCDVFTKGGPHFTEAGMKDVARLYAAAYAKR